MAVQHMLTIQTKIPGQKNKAASDWQVPLPPEVNSSHSLKLCDLIAYVVRNEVQAFHQRQQERRLARILSPNEINESAQRGKIDLGERDLKQSVDEEAAVAVAIQAFEDGLYFVFLDDIQQHDLNQQVIVTPNSHLLFVRLVALSGG